ncbi:hypothetical protein AB836_00780 [Rickettsiales bacterium (ex Bugula neritina AB1)]|nr:hypothetical protein AB836_00780 [Rickettsiales bacterium (ex Bugula neritina AB1)]
MFKFLKDKIQNQILNNSKVHKESIGNQVFRILVESDLDYNFSKKISDEIQKLINDDVPIKNAFTNVIKNNMYMSNIKKGIVTLIGFQGHGKTTNINKLAYFLRKKGWKVAVATTDTNRYAATEQLYHLAEKNNINIIKTNANNSNEIAKEILSQKENYDSIIIDTPGINPNNKESIQHLNNILNIISPNENLLVLNSLLGSSVFKMIENFLHVSKPITGGIITNMDGDTKGGVCLSFSYITKKPIYFISNGEKIHDLEYFNSDSISNRIVGDMDFVGLQGLLDNYFSKSTEEKFMYRITNKLFNFEDMIFYLTHMQNFGLERIMSFVGNRMKPINIQEGEKNIKIFTNIINSMTKKERKNPNLINNLSRMKRISKGSGYSINTVQQLSTNYEELKKKIFMLSDMLKSNTNPQDILKKFL